MRFRVSFRLPRRLTVCLCSLILVSAALVGTAASTAHVAHAATGPNTAIGCGAERHDPSQFSGSFGGYVGYDSQGNYCDGSFSYVLTPTSAFAIWPVNFVHWSNTGFLVVEVFVYIPNVNAGAVVDYDATLCDNEGTGACQVQPLVHTFDQNAVSGWQYVGYVLLDYLQELTQVELSSHQASHFDMAEDAIGLAV